MTYRVICEDGAVRHDTLFDDREDAARFAEWGHICLANHAIEPTQTWTVAGGITTLATCFEATLLDIFDEWHALWLHQDEIGMHPPASAADWDSFVASMAAMCAHEDGYSQGFLRPHLTATNKVFGNFWTI